MLKRFMNWLLHRLQNLLGKKRGSSSAPNQSRQNYDGQGSQQGNRPVATSRPTVPVIEPAPKPTAPLTPETLAPEEDPAATEGPFESDTPDTHRRVDIAPPAIPDIKTVSPTFPTEVSELMGSPSNSDDSSATETANAELPVRSLKKIPTSQLPGIHDLLPAVEPSTSEDALPSDVLEPSSAPEQVAEPEQAAPSAPEQTAEQAEPEQATLFSFDIIEREPVDTDERGDELLAEEPSDEGSAADILGSDSDLESPEEAVLPAQISIEMEAAIETDPVDARIETLPYPWSLPVTEDSSPEANQTAAPTEPSTEKSEVAQNEPTSDLAEPISEDRLTKNGVVKLLFTLKEGNFHGYIAPDDGTKDILFHQKYINADVFPLLERGVRVTAAIKYIEGKAYATRVDLQ